MSLLVARGVWGGYGGAEVVRGVDLRVGPGECVAVLGPNGAGKTTLLRLLSGVLPLRSGAVELLGRPLERWRRRDVAKVMGFVPQIVSFTFPLSVRELVEQGRAPHLGAWRPPSDRDAAMVSRALARVGLEGRADAPVQKLSGGERQRVLLARALASEPRLLILDEPAANLDVHHQLAFIATLRSLLLDGVGIVLVAHDWNLALRVATEMVLLEAGQVRAVGPAPEVLTPAVLAEVFGVEVEILTRADGSSVVFPVETR